MNETPKRKRGRPKVDPENKVIQITLYVKRGVVFKIPDLKMALYEYIERIYEEKEDKV